MNPVGDNNCSGGVSIADDAPRLPDCHSMKNLREIQEAREPRHYTSLELTHYPIGVRYQQYDTAAENPAFVSQELF